MNTKGGVNGARVTVCLCESVKKGNTTALIIITQTTRTEVRAARIKTETRKISATT